MLTFSLDKLALKPNSKVLDVGCGEGRHIFGSLYEFSDIHCVGLDQDIPSLNKCNEGLEFFKELNSGSTIFMQGSVERPRGSAQGRSGRSRWPPPRSRPRRCRA